MPDLPLLTWGLLVAAALLAGWVDAVVGGGGLVQLPALLIGLPNASPIQLLATNKLASICGTSVAAATYARRIPPRPALVIPLAIGALLGSAGGALVGSNLRKETFTPLVLGALVAVGAWTLFKPDAARLARRIQHHENRGHSVVGALLGLVIGFWDGAIGPGTGSFFIVALVALLNLEFLPASGTAKIGNFMTNLAALIVFVPQGAVIWGLGLAMGLANLLGGYLGARTALRLGNSFVRTILLVVVSGFIVRLGGQVLGWW